MLNTLAPSLAALLKPSWGGTPHATGVQAELIRILYDKTPTVLVGVSLTATIIAIIFYNQADNIQLFSWLVTLYVLNIVRFLSFRKFKTNTNEHDEIISWGRLYAFFAFISGLIWGAASFILFDPQQMLLFMIFTLILLGITVASIAALSAFLSAYYAYIVPALLPLVWCYTSVEDQSFNIFGLSILVFLIALFPFAKVNQRSLSQSIILRFENIELIQQLTKEKEKAENANIAKTKFLAAASHDLRQPLHAIGMFTGALENRLQKPENKSIVHKLQKSCHALNGLLDSLLDISKLDAGIVRANPQNFCIQTLFDSLKNEFESTAVELNLRLSFVKTRLCISSDYIILERIFRNLISNALRYTHSGGVVVGCRRVQGEITIAVYDSGIGIKQDDIGEIFNEFHQLHNPERDRSKGLGLGLAIVKRMAKLLSLDLAVSSVPGQGSMFGLVVPARYIRTQSLQTPPPAVATSSFADRTVLIVDDEIDIRDSLTTLLHSWNCSVIAAASGAEALGLLADTVVRPDVILADYRLRHGETGNDVIAGVQALFPEDKIPAFIITGDTAPDRISKATAGDYRVIHKPVSPSTLQQILGETLNMGS